MKPTDSMAATIRELAVFCLEHRGTKCLRDCDAAKVFRYVAFHLLNGTLFVARDKNRKVQIITFAWLDDSVEVVRRAAADESQFNWQPTRNDGDSLLVGDVIGQRRWFGKIVEQIKARWPDSPRKRLFTYRGEKPALKEFDLNTVLRFAYVQSQNT